MQYDKANLAKLLADTFNNTRKNILLFEETAQEKHNYSITFSLDGEHLAICGKDTNSDFLSEETVLLVLNSEAGFIKGYHEIGYKSDLLGTDTYRTGSDQLVHMSMDGLAYTPIETLLTNEKEEVFYYGNR